MNKDKYYKTLYEFYGLDNVQHYTQQFQSLNVTEQQQISVKLKQKQESINTTFAVGLNTNYNPSKNKTKNNKPYVLEDIRFEATFNENSISIKCCDHLIAIDGPNPQYNEYLCNIDDVYTDIMHTVMNTGKYDQFSLLHIIAAIAKKNKTSIDKLQQIMIKWRRRRMAQHFEYTISNSVCDKLKSGTGSVCERYFTAGNFINDILKLFPESDCNFLLRICKIKLLLTSELFETYKYTKTGEMDIKSQFNLSRACMAGNLLFCPPDRTLQPAYCRMANELHLMAYKLRKEAPDFTLWQISTENIEMSQKTSNKKITKNISAIAKTKSVKNVLYKRQFEAHLCSDVINIIHKAEILKQKKIDNIDMEMKQQNDICNVEIDLSEESDHSEEEKEIELILDVDNDNISTNDIILTEQNNLFMTEIWRLRKGHISCRNLVNQLKKSKIKFCLCSLCGTAILNPPLCYDCIRNFEQVTLIKSTFEKYRNFESVTEEFLDDFENALEEFEITNFLSLLHVEE